MTTTATTRIDALARDTFSISREALNRSIRRAMRASLRPSPRLKGGEWVEKYAHHSMETSGRTGKFEMFPFQRDLLNLATDPEWSEVVFMKSARVGYTQMMTFLMGYYVQHDPSKIAFILPTDKNIGEFSKDSFNPMVRDTKVVAKLRGGVSMDDKLNRFFSNGSVVYLRSAFSSDEMRRITAGILMLDEIDADGWDPMGQGDKISLTRKRAETVSNSRIFMGSTPNLKGSSRIEDAYIKGTMHRRFVPCPHCTAKANPDLFAEAEGDWFVFGELMRKNGVVFEGHQVLEWGDGETFGIHYKTDPENPTYICRHCGEHIDHALKGWMDEHGEWRATNYDENGKPAWNKGRLSFHINTLYSQFEKASWAHAVAAWRDIEGDPEKRQTFENTWLGLSFEDWSAAGKARKPHELQETHVVDYGGMVPKWVHFLTAGVDTQSAEGGRFEVTITGWGAGERKAVIAHFVLDQHELKDPTAWDELASTLSLQYKTMDNRLMTVAAAAIDSGGHYGQEVYDFCARHSDRQWWAIKGHGTQGKGTRGDRIWPRAISDNGRSYSVDVNLAKDKLYRQLNGEPDAPGGIVFPRDALPGSVSFDALYFERLTREKPLPVKGQPGKTFWSSPKDQEPWDCLIYSMAAMYGLLQAFPRRYQHLVASPPKAPSKGRPGPQPKPAVARPAVDAPKPHVPFVAPAEKPSERPKAKVPNWLQTRRR